jgi:hypothetical protein
LARLPKTPATEKSHALALEHLAAQSPKPPPDREPPTERSFGFSQPTALQIEFSVRATEPPTLAGLRAFLWRTGGELPPNVTANQVERVVVENASDRRQVELTLNQWCSSKTMILILLNIDNGDSFQKWKSWTQQGFCSVNHCVPVKGGLAVLLGVEDDLHPEHQTDARPVKVQDFVQKTGIHSFPIHFGTSHGTDKFPMETKLS